MAKYSYSDIPNKQITLPFATASWPELTDPNYYHDKKRGDYSCNVTMRPEDAKEWIDIIDEFRDKEVLPFLEKNENPKKYFVSRNCPYEEESIQNKETEEYEATGLIKFKIGNKAAFERKNGDIQELHYPIVDIYGEPFNGEVGGGSIVSVICTIQGYYVSSAGAGVCLKMDAVMVKEARSGRQRDAKAMFGDMVQKRPTDASSMLPVANAENDKYAGMDDDDIPF